MSEKISHWAWVGMKYRPKIKRDTKRFAEELCKACGYTLEQVKERTRKREIVNVRQQIIYVLEKRDEKATRASIGRVFELDRTTIIHSIEAAEKHIAVEPEYKERIEMLMSW